MINQRMEKKMEIKRAIKITLTLVEQVKKKTPMPMMNRHIKSISGGLL
jgi:hypothetical protein